MGVKNYDVDGVAAELQLGKNGPKVIGNQGAIAFRDADGGLAQLVAAPASTNDELVTLEQLTGVNDKLTTAVGNFASEFVGEMSGKIDPLRMSITVLQTDHQAAVARFNGQIDTLNATIADLQATVGKLFPGAATEYVVRGDLRETVDLGKLNPGWRILSIEVDVTSPFDGAATLSIGDGLSADHYMTGDMTDLNHVGTYGVTPPPPSDDRSVKLALAGAPTTGEATVRLRYA